MKRFLVTACMAVAVVSLAVDFAAAQGRGGGFGGRGGGFGGGQADTISDALVLKADRAAKVEAIVQDVQEEMRGGFQDMGDFQSMSQEERMEAFTKMREKSQTALLTKLAAVLSKDEIEFVKPVIENRGARTVSEVRALRQIELDDATRGKLQTVVLIYMNTAASLRPQFTPGQGRGQGQGGQRGPGGMSEADQAKLDEAQTAMIGDIKKTLNDDQIKAWEAKTAEVEKEMEAQRAQRGQGGQRGGANN